MRNLSVRLVRATRVAWRFSGLLALGLLAAACQTDPETPQGAQTYKANVPASVLDSVVTPERAVLHVGKDSSAAAVSASNLEIKIDLAQTPGSKDTAVMVLWRSGVKLYELDYVYKGEFTFGYTGVKRPNALALAIFKRIAPKNDLASFEAELAKLLVDNDSLVQTLGFPAKSIVGVDSARVVREAMKYLASKGSPLAALVPKTGAWALGLDTGTIHGLVQKMVQDSLIKTDTTKLFPPYPVRVKGAIGLAAQLVAGGDAVGVTGSFEATYKIVNLSSKVVRDGQDLTKSFEITPISFSEYPKTLDLAGKIEIRAKEGAATGNYTLEITVQDDSLRKATASVAFQVLPAADKIGPEIRFVQPASDTALSNSVGTLDVKVVAIDPSGVDSVWIDAKPAKLVDGVWVVTGIAIPVADLGYSVAVRARDSKGNASNASILAVRKAVVDPGRPTLTVLAPKQGEEFVYDSSSILVRWKVEDPRGEVVKVWIGGEAATLEGANVWARRVELPATGTLTTIALLAVNVKGDSSTSFVQASRKVDTKGPSIEILSPLADAGFLYEVASTLVRAKVTDPSGVDSVKINGVKSEATTGGEFIRNLDLEAGKTTEILVEAWDKLLNKQNASIKVSRKGPPDASAPQFVLLAPKVSGEIVPLAASTYTLKWLVTDLFGLADTGVRIGGVLATRSKDTFSLAVPAPLPGKEQSYRVDAINTKGNANFETVTLKRAADVDGPIALRVDSGRSVAFETEKATVSWKVSDNFKLASVTINDKPITGVDGLYSTEIALAFGSNPARLVAKDEAGNVKVDSVFVVRTWKDTSKPVITREMGTDTKNVGFDVASVELGWKVSDNAKVAVTISGKATLPNSSGVYAYTLTLTGTSTGVKIVATDSSGNVQSDTLTISKSSDAVMPAFVRLTGTKDTAVPYATTTYSVAWKVTDNGTLATVEINGKPANKVGDIYSLDVLNLLVGKNPIRIKAIDASNNIAWDSIVVQRGYHDSIAPSVQRADTATVTKTVQYARDTATVSWTVTDNDAIKSVTLNGVAISKIGGVYSKKLTLAVGPNVVILAAYDTANNFKGDTLTITRANKDSIAPAVVRAAGTGPTSVAFEATTATVTWTVTDNVKVGMVKINDTVTAASSSAAYSRTLALAVGNNPVKLVATDSAGNATIDTFTIVRIYKDTVKPVVTRGTGASTRSVGYATTETSVAWTVTDNKKLSSVTINGTEITGALNVFTETISLDIGANVVKLVATDSTGNSKTDSVVITRADCLASHITKFPNYLIGAGDTLTIQIDTLTLGNPAALKSLEWMPKGGSWASLSMSSLTNVRLPVATSEDSSWYLYLRTKSIPGIYTYDTLRIRVMQSFRDPRDGKLYRVAKVGNALWFGQSLNYNSGNDDIGNPTSTCAPFDTTCERYGRYYRISQPLRYVSRDSIYRDGFCPDGWHIPDTAEFRGLLNAFAQKTSTNISAVGFAMDENWGTANGDPFGLHFQRTRNRYSLTNWYGYEVFRAMAVYGKVSDTTYGGLFEAGDNGTTAYSSINAWSFANDGSRYTIRCVGNVAPTLDAGERLQTSPSLLKIGVSGTPAVATPTISWKIGGRSGILSAKVGWNSANIVTWDTLGTVVAEWTVTAGAAVRRDTSYLQFIKGFTDSRDNKTYSATKIGSQTWMRSNLDFEAIGSVNVDDLDGNRVRVYSKAQAYNGEVPAVGKKLKGVCPEGWHLPSQAEWGLLLSTVASTWWAKGTASLMSNGAPRYPVYGDDYTGFGAIPTVSADNDGNPSWDFFDRVFKYAIGDNSIGAIPSGSIVQQTLSWSSDMYSVRCLQD